jgi:hypothetical protein
LHELLGRSETGPPVNKHHVREWSYLEFEQYIRTHFNVIEHKSIKKEYGQMIHCQP